MGEDLVYCLIVTPFISFAALSGLQTGAIEGLARRGISNILPQSGLLCEQEPTPAQLFLFLYISVVYLSSIYLSSSRISGYILDSNPKVLGLSQTRWVAI